VAAVTRSPGGKAAEPRLSADANAPAHERLAAQTVLVMAIATPVAIGFHYVYRYYWGVGYPWSTFLVHPHWRFNDYFLSYRDAVWFQSGMSHTMVYSPMMHLLMTALTNLTPRTGFAIVVGVFLVVLALVCWKWITAAATIAALRLQQVAVLMLLSYPVLFVVDRGNLEMVVFVLLAAFFYLYYGRRSRWAWIPLALAIGSKYYWVTLLVLPLSDRQVRQAVYAVLGAVGGTLAATAVIAWNTHYSIGSVLHDMLQTLGSRRDAFGALHTVQHAHTLWASIQLVNRLLYYPFSGIRNFGTGYFLVAAMLFLLVAYEVLSHDMAPWRKVLALVAATLVLPVESFDYTLLHLYFPLALLVCCATTRWPARLAGLLIGVCLVPVDYEYFKVTGMVFDVGISTFIYCGALLALILVALVTRERERRPLRSLLVWDSWPATADTPGAAVDEPGAAKDACPAAASPAANGAEGPG
jgi:Glycosyltransferase family 87